MSSIPDEELLERYSSSPSSPEGRAAVDELFGRYHRRVALWCFRITGDRDRALDLAQEVFLRAYRGLASFQGNAKFSTWLYTIARNHCFNSAKTQSRRPVETTEPGLLDLLRSDSLSPQQELEQSQTEQTAQALLEEALNETERAAMVLHYRDELPLDAVTRMLKLTNASGAKAAIVSAKRKLARALERRQRIAPKSGG